MREAIDDAASSAEDMIRKVAQGLGGKITVDVARDEDEENVQILLGGWVALTVYWGDYTEEPSLRPKVVEKVIYGITTYTSSPCYPGGEDMEEEMPHCEYDQLVTAVIEMFSLYHGGLIAQIIQGVEEHDAQVKAGRMYDEWESGK